MPKRTYFTASLLLMAIVCLFIWRSDGGNEPMYNGRPVSSWLEGHVASSSVNPPYGSPGWREADAALRKIGTNAIPTLLRMIQAKDYPPPVIKIWDWALNHHLTHRHYRYAFNQNMEALYAFQMLGKGAAAAVPELIRIYSKKVSWHSKNCAASALASIGSAARPALPMLLSDFSSTNKQERFDAVSAVMNIGGDTNIVLPALLSAAKDTDVDVRWNAIVGLSMYEERARVAVPMLLDALHDTAKVGNTPITEAVETALWRIAPEYAGKPLVIAHDPPMANGTRTSCCIEFGSGGKRKTAIPADASIPAVGDFWNNDPRGTIAVYVRDASKNQEALLGEFELQNMPELAGSVSLVCVVAEGKILLNARNNVTEKFLEIRKIK